VVTGAFRRRPDVLWRRSLDAVVLLPLGAEDVITLAGTGVAVWELLDTWRTVDALTELLSLEYHAEPATVRADLEPLIDQLVSLGTLETAADSGGPSAG
jgi:hypothetical protein